MYLLSNSHNHVHFEDLEGIYETKDKNLGIDIDKKEGYLIIDGKTYNFSIKEGSTCQEIIFYSKDDEDIVYLIATIDLIGDNLSLRIRSDFFENLNNEEIELYELAKE